MTTSFHTRHPLLTTATTLLLAAALFAGCGGGTSGSPTIPAVVPTTGSTPVAASVAPAAASVGAGSSSSDTTGTCGVVTAEAVGKAAGFVVATSSGAPGVCIFQNADHTMNMAVQVYDSQAAMATPLSIESGSEHIANLGDDAFWVPQVGIFFVRKGDHAVQFTDPSLATDATNTATKDALVTLAKLALPHI